MLLGFILMGGVLSTGLMLLGFMLFGGMSYADVKMHLRIIARDPASLPGGWYELMSWQAVNHLGSFLLPALAYWYRIERRTWSQFNPRPLEQVAGFSLVVLIVILFMPFDGLIIEWNQNIHLPQTLAPIEEWVRDKDQSTTAVTRYLTTFATTPQLLVALLVIAIIPGIGEEVLFRGVLQRMLMYWTGNKHLAIWLAAALFSAIHVQFLGFFPRMLMGALFGYLYVWSGNIWVPILAHFTNNGFTVFMVYLYQQKMTSIDVEKTEAVPMLGALAAGLLTTGLLYYFQQRNRPQLI
ncbi:CPBP family intramembrane metalloprotease [Spirosoma rhododendri]|uniref:CPBP family intramembrane metalloprotease n=2 Tax=Spirosoma rhododendri TaxID=2728024 RepID=A0A7L5DZL7_9BACT|nr:CPBP family intramembrane glutamic endopeptidase [Spirosoma rhododendri]QJD81437.1 CPBP family intramembrane metalloprotease [Spirosoma rhododendri]